MDTEIFGNLAEWATAIITLASAFFIIVQLQLDHERSRRENSVDLVREWTDRQRLETAMVVRLVKTFNESQCLSLYAGSPFWIDETQENTVKSAAALRKIDISTKISSGKIRFDADDVAVLRFFTMGYLNLLESTLLGWNSGIAAGDVIHFQFKYLRKEHHSLPTCREAIQSKIGDDPFPSITNFLSAPIPTPAKPLGFFTIFSRS